MCYSLHFLTQRCSFISSDETLTSYADWGAMTKGLHRKYLENGAKKYGVIVTSQDTACWGELRAVTALKLEIKTKNKRYYLTFVLSVARFFCFKFSLKTLRFTSHQRNWQIKKLSNLSKLQFLNDKIYNCTKRNIWHLAIWQNWCFGQFYCLEIKVSLERIETKFKTEKASLDNLLQRFLM